MLCRCGPLSRPSWGMANPAGAVIQEGDYAMVAIGVMLPLADRLITSGSFLREFARAAEDCGVESVWAVEHVILADAYEPLYPYSIDGYMPVRPDAVTLPDPLETLSFIAAASTSLKLGTGMVIAPLHSPATLAKRAATIDRLSEGRLMLGLSIGWHKEEYDAVGVPFKDRGHRLDDCIDAMRELWRGGPASYSGKYVSFDRVHSLPRPTDGRVPIVLGGMSEAAIQRAAVKADGWFPHDVAVPEFAAGSAHVRDLARAAGRDPSAIEITVWPGSKDPSTEFDLDVVRSYVEAGATRLIMMPYVERPDQIGEAIAQVQRYRDQVIEKL